MLKYPVFFVKRYRTTGWPDSWAKAVLNADSNRFDYENRLPAMPHCAESGFLLPVKKMPNLKFYFTAMILLLERRKSAQCCDSAQCRIAQSSDSSLCGIARSQHMFANFSAHSEPHAKILSNDQSPVTQVWLIHEKNRGSKISWDCPFKWWGKFWNACGTVPVGKDSTGTDTAINGKISMRISGTKKRFL
jgi:hypothetical protein